MAYNPYPYGGYQPTTGYYPGPVPDQLAQLRQNQIQQIPPNMMQPAPNLAQQPQAIVSGQQTAPAGAPQNSGIIWVSGKQEADGYMIAPNSAVALWDQNNPVVYLRQADSTGKPSTKVYDLVERVNNPSPQQAVSQIDPTQFITREEFSDAVHAAVEEVLAERMKRSSKPAKQKEDIDNG